MDIELSVIIVNYNGKHFLKDCFASLQEHLKGVAYEVVVVDNNSADGSCNYIREHFPEVVLISSEENFGFGKGNNLGVLNSRGEYILLLNNDTVLLSDIKPVVDMLKQSGSIGAVTINMVNGEKKYIMPAGRFPKGFNLYRIKNLSDMGQEFATGRFSKDYYEVDWVSGAFMMMPKKVFNEAGGFDEDYFMYVEDVDLCKKIESSGYKRVFLPGYSYIHYVGHNKTRDHYLIAGYETYIKKHHQGLAGFLLQTSLNINKAVKKIKAVIN